MPKTSKAKIATVAVVLLALVAGLATQIRWRMPNLRAFLVSRPDAGTAGPNDAGHPQTEPEDTVYRMLNAARDGNVEAYLDSYTGEMEASLRQTLAQRTSQGFAKDLQGNNRTMQRIVVGEPVKVSDREAAVRVEYVYEHRHEIQVLHLSKGTGGWKIFRSETGNDVAP